MSVGLVLLYPLVWYGVLPDWLDKAIRAIVHFDMGMLGLMLCFILARDIIFLPLHLLKVEWAYLAFSRSSTLFMAGVSLTLLLIGFYRAHRGPDIVNVQIPVKGLPHALENYTILQISDLHAGAGINAKYVNEVVQKAMYTKADVIVLTGDIADGSFEKYQHSLNSLSQLTSQCKVLYVVGNHEYHQDSDKWLNYFKGLGIEVLLNQHSVITSKGNTLLFAGVVDPSAKEVDHNSGPDIQKTLHGSPAADVRILLAHQPNIAEEASNHFDLQLSGHTHGGQFFPWNLVINMLQPYARGLKQCNNMWVYTNSGTGYWGPPFRLGTTSEITVLKLVKQ
jgi:predicted MPP superfamily phosphohydrolase